MRAHGIDPERLIASGASRRSVVVTPRAARQPGGDPNDPTSGKYLAAHMRQRLARLKAGIGSTPSDPDTLVMLQQIPSTALEIGKADIESIPAMFDTRNPTPAWMPDFQTVSDPATFGRWIRDRASTQVGDVVDRPKQTGTYFENLPGKIAKSIGE